MENTASTTSLNLNLGVFLRDRRGRLDPLVLGFSNTRRRTPGLRREEVAQRAHISTTWYTWLEQGRGGAPSAEVLNRISRALLLTEAEHEHLFMLGLGHLPPPKYRTINNVEPRLQRVLDAFQNSPALIKTATWDIVAWNKAATVVFTDYSLLSHHERNLMRLLFCSQQKQRLTENWEDFARFAVSAFRIDSIKAGANAEITELVKELMAASSDFAHLWNDKQMAVDEVQRKFIQHPVLGAIELEGSIFAVDGRSDLSLVVHNPVHQEDIYRIEALLKNEPIP